MSLQGAPVGIGQTIGIIGGGQLARMSGQAARTLGYRVIIADPDPDCPAAAVADQVLVARLDDPAAIAPLAGLCQVVTYEFENISPAVLERLSPDLPVYPGAHLLRATQNRVAEKSALAEMKVPVAPWRAVESRRDFDGAIAAIGLPAVLKTATEGYDGKGQVVIREPGQAAAAYAQLQGKPLILEGFVAFEREISVVVARSATGQVAAFPAAENIHRLNILDISIVPARVSALTAEAARALAVRIATRLELVGVLGVELFALPDGSLLVNELAPRPHNSGHWSLNGCVTSQFEQHIRAVAGLPLGGVQILQPTVMVNIMGEHYPLDLTAALQDPDVKLHLYGKREARPHRKMGHLNLSAPTVQEALERALGARERLSGGK